MTGPISFEFAIACAGVVSVAVAIAVWVIQVFQTKTDALESERRMREQFDKEISVIKKSVEDVHKHLETVRSEFKDYMRTIHGDIRSMRDKHDRMGEDVAWVKGHMERRNRDVVA